MEKLQKPPDVTPTPSAELVREHLNRILSSPHFRTSRRSSEFLSYVVDQTLEGRQTEIKERTIGAAVFGRPHDYETPADPIVRVKANEVRKRLAQYYGESGAEESLQIELPAGAYVPAFHWRDSHLTTRTLVTPADVHPTVAPPVLAQSAGSRRLYLSLGAFAVLLLAGGFVASKVIARPSALDQFWAPVVHSAGTPLICVGTGDTWMLSHRLKAELERIGQTGDSPVNAQVWPGDFAHLLDFHMSSGNFESVLALSLLLASKGTPPQLRLGAMLSLQDIGAHPVILIGAFNNPWTIQGNAKLRFSFEGDGADEHAPLAIRDSLHPENRWVVSDRFPWKKQTVDYAVISRFFDPSSGNVFVTVAGINAFGSQAAGEFLSVPRYWKELAETAPPGWQKKNLQIVLETNVVGTTPSPPRVLATHFW